MVVAFYGFQRVPDVRIVTSGGGWQGWFDESAAPLIEAGISDHHLHNPFGLHKIDGRDDRVMHIDQFELSFCQGLHWLADRAGFRKAVGDVRDRGGTVRAYVGSPLQVHRRPQDTYLPGCSPDARRLSALVRLRRAMGACGGPLGGGCACWNRVIRFHIRPLVDAGVNAIGFDNSADFQPGDCMDGLVRSLLAKGIEVMIEPWPRKDREYPPVNWVIRELMYQRILFGLVDRAAPADAVPRPYRIVPPDTDAGRLELADINKIRTDAGEECFRNVQEVLEAVIRDGHTPVVRASQLESGGNP